MSDNTPTTSSKNRPAPPGSTISPAHTQDSPSTSKRRRGALATIALVGPAFVVGAWQFGPGNLASAVQAGSKIMTEGGLDVGGWRILQPEHCPDPILGPCPTDTRTQQLLTHGTAVASVLAGSRTGIAPDARLVAVSVTGDETRWVIALQKVIEHAFAPDTPQFRTAIVNISGGLSLPRDAQPQVFDELMRRMIGGVDRDGNSDPDGKRFLFVAAAGNAGQCTRAGGFVEMYPAVAGMDIDGLVTVGGLARDNTLWEGGCKGPALEVLAPAEDMLVAEIAGKDLYRWIPSFLISGTSYATPYVSAMAARLLEADPALTPAQLEARLKSSPSRAAGLPVPVELVTVTPKRRASR